MFNKKSGRLTVHAVKTRKQYQYIQTLLASALIMLINDRVGMKMTALAPDDPRLIWHPLNHPYRAACETAEVPDFQNSASLKLVFFWTLFSNIIFSFGGGGFGWS